MSTAATTAPASTSRTTLAPVSPAVPIVWTTRAAMPPPSRATQAEATVPVETPSHTLALTIAAAAPALMPSSPGSARGLTVTPCIRAPETASAAPTPTARRVRSIAGVEHRRE